MYPTFRISALSRIPFLLSTLAGSLWAQSAGPASLTNWPAPLYWQPPVERSASKEAAPRAANLSGPLTFIGVTPCRPVDTRGESGQTGAFGPPVMGATTSRTFPIPASPCGIPSTAKAYSFNVTVVPAQPLGYLTIWPTGSAQPFVSTLNSPSGAVVANAAIVPAGSNGSVDVFVTNMTHVVIDINGYYADAPVQAAPLTVATKFDNITISSPKLSVADNHAAPGATFTLTANLSIGARNCPVCLQPIAIGIVGQTTSQGCIDSGFNGDAKTVSRTITLTAPVTPGTYFIGADTRGSMGLGCSSTVGDFVNLPANQYVIPFVVY